MPNKMRVHYECIPCFINQTVKTLNLLAIPEPRKIDIVMAIMKDLTHVDLTQPPAFATTYIYQRIIRETGKDPYKPLKHEYNGKALALYPDLLHLTLNHSNPLWMATRAAIAGNIIDFGIYDSVNIEATVHKAINNDIAIDDFTVYSSAIHSNDNILYLLDNAGEAVFDMILIEVLENLGKNVTAVVRGAPVINDVTREDALEIGLTSKCRVIDNGSDAVGTFLSSCSDSFVAEYNNASLIISKGQANFETLKDKDKNIYFLFQAKCDVIARELGVTRESMILKQRSL